MSAPPVQSQNKIRVADLEMVKVKEDCEMRLTMRMTKVKRQLSEILATQHPVKLLGGLALGALLMTATGLHFAPTNADEAASLSSVQGWVDHDYEDDIVITGSPSFISTATVDREFDLEAMAAHPDLDDEVEWYLTFGTNYPHELEQ